MNPRSSSFVRIHRASFAMGLALLGLVSVGLLAPGPLRAEGWSFRLSPYIWATSLKGTTSVGPLSSDIDLGFDDILRNLDMALMLNFRAENGPWAIQADGVWADLEFESTSGIRSTEVGTTMVIGSLDGRYTFAEHWEVLAGARYMRQEVDFDLTIGPVASEIDATADWVDPIVGIAFKSSIDDEWSFALQGDVGGFGVGSDLTWQAWANFDWRFSRVGSLALGWRHLYWDYSEGKGAKRFAYDAYMSGPVIGVSFRF